MKFQTTKSSCGPAALGNALQALGIQRSEEELAALCKTTPQGTTARNLRGALATIEGVRNVAIEESRPDVAALRLMQAIYEGRPVICCVDGWEHYAVAVGVLGFGKRIVVVDSGDNDLVVVKTVDEFLDWWRGPGKKSFWGVVL